MLELQLRIVVGELVPVRLDIEANQIMDWSDWKEAHGDSEVLSRETDTRVSNNLYERDQYSNYRESSRIGFDIDNVDPRLPEKEIVKGVSTETGEKAYPEDTVRDEEIINDEISGTSVVVFVDPESNGIKVFERPNDLSFDLEGENLVDSNGDTWSLTGEREDEQLNEFQTSGFFWFAWEKFNPETGVYQR